MFSVVINDKRAVKELRAAVAFVREKNKDERVIKG
jgi:hypothetical protein